MAGQSLSAAGASQSERVAPCICLGHSRAPPQEHGVGAAETGPQDQNLEFWRMGKHTWNPEPWG